MAELLRLERRELVSMVIASFDTEESELIVTVQLILESTEVNFGQRCRAEYLVESLSPELRVKVNQPGRWRQR